MKVNYLYITKIKNKRQQCHGGLSSKTPCLNYNYYISFINICQDKNNNLIQSKILVMAEIEMYASAETYIFADGCSHSLFQSKFTVGTFYDISFYNME